jgi:L-amino acid N-acyltransferase YncA
VALTSALIRRIEERDWPQVHEIVVEVASAGETYAMDVPASVRETREFWSGQHVVVAVEGDTVLGSAKMGPNRPAQGAHVGTASFMVGGAARGRGIGRALAEHMVEWHRAAGFRGIQFNAVVSTNTSAVRLWESLGFETIGRVPGAFRLPDREYVDLLVMYLPLVSASTAGRTV